MAHSEPADGGFTLIEVLVSIMLFGILSTLSLVGFVQYRKAHEEQGSADALVAALRNTGQRATVESRSYCLRIGADNASWTVWRSTCGTGTQVSSGKTDSSSVTFPTGSRTFTDRSGATSSTDVYFYRSGMASAGTMTVARSGSSKVYTIRVEGLTGRVTSS